MPIGGTCCTSSVSHYCEPGDDGNRSSNRHDVRAPSAIWTVVGIGSHRHGLYSSGTHRYVPAKHELGHQLMHLTRGRHKVLAVMLLSGGLSVIVAGSLVAPVARADIDFECTPGCWGAIAASTSNGQEVIRYDYRSRHAAEDAAVLWCDVEGKTNDCELVTSGLGCLSIAQSSDGKVVAGRVAPTQDAADAAALDGAGPGATIGVHACNDAF